MKDDKAKYLSPYRDIYTNSRTAHRVFMVEPYPGGNLPAVGRFIDIGAWSWTYAGKNSRKPFQTKEEAMAALDRHLERKGFVLIDDWDRWEKLKLLG